MEKSLDRLAGFKPAGKLKSIPFPTLHTIMALNRGSGLPEFVHSFGESPSVDSAIVSGFISAIATFTSEMMGDKGLLRSITHEGFVLMMEYTDSRIIALVASEETFETRYRLHEFAAQFDSAYPPSDEEGVDASLYAGAENLVVKLFSFTEQEKKT
jgi:hypothetical protein